jgi:uncharacterized coiled-coil protein SlyX
MYEDELIEAKRAIVRLTATINDQSKTIEKQEKEIAYLKKEMLSLQPILNAWSARQRPPRDDCYTD